MLGGARQCTTRKPPRGSATQTASPLQDILTVGNAPHSGHTL